MQKVPGVPHFSTGSVVMWIFLPIFGPETSDSSENRSFVEKSVSELPLYSTIAEPTVGVAEQAFDVWNLMRYLEIGLFAFRTTSARSPDRQVWKIVKTRYRSLFFFRIPITDRRNFLPFDKVIVETSRATIGWPSRAIKTRGWSSIVNVTAQDPAPPACAILNRCLCPGITVNVVNGVSGPSVWRPRPLTRRIAGFLRNSLAVPSVTIVWCQAETRTTWLGSSMS